MDPAEYALMDEAEASMWWYRAVHAKIEESLGGFLSPYATALLDAGCGTGGLLARVARRFSGLSLFGVEIEPGAGRRAAAKSGATIVAASVNALPFADKSFDAVLSIDVLCHRRVDEAHALAEARRCLRRRGLIIVNVPAFDWLMSAHDERVHNARRYTAGGLGALLRANGFRPVKITYWNSLPFPLMVLRRKVFPPKDVRSDVQDYPALNPLFSGLMAAERVLARLGLALPFGGSVLAVAMSSDE